MIFLVLILSYLVINSGCTNIVYIRWRVNIDVCVNWREYIIKIIIKNTFYFNFKICRYTLHRTYQTDLQAYIDVLRNITNYVHVKTIGFLLQTKSGLHFANDKISFKWETEKKTNILYKHKRDFKECRMISNCWKNSTFLN